MIQATRPPSSEIVTSDPERAGAAPAAPVARLTNTTAPVARSLRNTFATSGFASADSASASALKAT